MKAVLTGSYKAKVGAETFWKSEPEREPKQIVSAPQHWIVLSCRYLISGFNDVVDPSRLKRTFQMAEDSWRPLSKVIFTGTLNLKTKPAMKESAWLLASFLFLIEIPLFVSNLFCCILFCFLIFGHLLLHTLSTLSFSFYWLSWPL